MAVLGRTLRAMKYLLHPVLFLCGILLMAGVSTYYQRDNLSATRLNQPVENCRTIQHVLGQACIPTHPERIVTLWSDILGNTLALEVKPVGASHYSIEHENSHFPIYLGDKTKDVEYVGSLTQPNLEKILLLKPDLILTNSVVQKNIGFYKELSYIAPTVVLDFPPPSQRSWNKLLQELAFVLDKTEVANNLVNKYRERVDNLKQALGNQSQQLHISVATVSANYGIYAYGENHPVGKVLSDIGFNRPPLLQGDFYYINLSEERLTDIDADVIFLLVSSHKRSTELLEQLQQKPIWRHLKAVKQNRVYPVDFLTWHGIDILSINSVLDDLFKYLVNTP